MWIEIENLVPLGWGNMASGDRPNNKWQVWAAVAGLVLIGFFLFGDGSEDGDDEPGINEQAAANLDSGDRPQLDLAPPAPQRSAGELAYLAELPDSSLVDGYRACDQLPASEADNGLYSFDSLVQNMGRIADFVYDDEWKTERRIAATHGFFNSRECGTWFKVG
jgi:hypothetical protein